MTKNYQIKCYLVDCKGYSWKHLEGLLTEELLDLVDKDIKECAEFLAVPVSYLKV